MFRRFSRSKKIDEAIQAAVILVSKNLSPEFSPPAYSRHEESSGYLQSANSTTTTAIVQKTWHSSQQDQQIYGRGSFCPPERTYPKPCFAFSRGTHINNLASIIIIEQSTKMGRRFPQYSNLRLPICFLDVILFPTRCGSELP